MTKDEFYFWSTIATLIVAMCALGLTFWQGFITRQHNKLSVKPMLKFVMKRELGFYELKLMNCGVGPALIRTFQNYFDSQPVSEEALLQSVLDIMEPESNYNVCSNADCFVIPVGESITILKVDHKSNDNLELSKIFSQRYWASVGYCSIYNEKKLSFEGEPLDN